MKTSWVIAGALVVISGSAFGLRQWQSQNQQLAAYEQHVQNLLNDVENLSRQRLDADSRVNQLTRELEMLRRQAGAAPASNPQTSSVSSVDIAQIEQRIRRELQRETQRQTTPSNTTAGLIRQLSQLSPQEIGDLMNLQGRYGAFLQALNVDDARMEVIVNGLSNLIAEQNSARMELLRDMQQQTTTPEEFREKIQALDDPAALADAMAFILTDEEQALFQAMQPPVAPGPFGARVVGGRAGSYATFIATPDGTTTQTNMRLAVPGDNNELLNYEIITAEPVIIDRPPD